MTHWITAVNLGIVVLSYLNYSYLGLVTSVQFGMLVPTESPKQK